MGTKDQKPLGEFMPSGLAGFLTMVAASFVFFAVSYGFEKFLQSRGPVGEAVPYILYDLIIAAGCFSIVRRNPSSIWYIPLLCNVLGILAAFMESKFWTTNLWIPYIGGWVLSVLVSLIGAWVGKRDVS
jgi:hypothetical protein